MTEMSKALKEKFDVRVQERRNTKVLHFLDT